MNLLPKNKDGCPFLILAPMEGVGDRSFRKAMASIGGFDEGVRDFLRVPAQPHIPSLAAKYESDELAPIPLAAQLMGSDPFHMAAMAREMQARGAQRIDLNCGCPSNTVTGRGAGSSLLKEPSFLYEIAKAMVNAVSIPVTAKLRSGFEDTSLFKENLLAAQESGINFLTLHPRTKAEGYGPPARWDLIAEAKSILKIPVVGNGDILNVQDALKMVRETRCDALMIGRGSIINPFIFHQIKAYYAKETYTPTWDMLSRYFDVYLAEMAPELSEKSKIGKMKQLMGFLFKGNEQLLALRNDILRAEHSDMPAFLEFAMGHLRGNLRFI